VYFVFIEAETGIEQTRGREWRADRQVASEINYIY